MYWIYLLYPLDIKVGSHRYLNRSQQLIQQPHVFSLGAGGAAFANKMHARRKARGNSGGKRIPRCRALTPNTLLGSEHLVCPLAVVAEGIHHLASSWALTFNHPIIWFLSESGEINKLNLAFTEI